MDFSTHKFTHVFLLSLGFVLIIAGIATETKGAPIIGLIVAGVNLRHWLRFNSSESTSDNGQTNG